MRNLKISILAIILLVLLVCPQAQAVDWIGANQSTIAWDPVTSLDNGDPIPPDDKITYRVYTKPAAGGAETPVGDTAQLKYTISFSQEGRYLIGVRTVRVPENETAETLSVILWSDSIDVEAVPIPFGIVFYVAPSEPKGFGVE